ncbi:unnamed protein product [Phaedon cochleariae]|uniref:Uncharacterized protein n=1 Tax=Phaedon cochleariae TaxID=80249 RepID=A0A9N9SHQ8_PHACE|nr:unnamed protein product [Phaedon cochleariae]
MSVTLFSVLVLPRGGFYFNSTGMMACDPFYSRASIRILAACGFYFPTTMILMYCYGSAFHVNKLRLRKSGCNFFCQKKQDQKEHQQSHQNFQHQPHCCSNIIPDPMVTCHNHAPGCDLEGLSEKYWGEILERTLSSNSLHALQRAYSHTRMDSCNGLQQHEMRTFDTAAPDL